MVVVLSIEPVKRMANANLVVNTDADQVIVAQARRGVNGVADTLL
jgi:hypothetical protein